MVGIKKDIDTTANLYKPMSTQDSSSETISNQDLWRITAQVPVEKEIKRRKWDGWGIDCGNLTPM
jgi:hypothetical protein